MPCGVMATREILVLEIKVRILTGQIGKKVGTRSDFILEIINENNERILDDPILDEIHNEIIDNFEEFEWSGIGQYVCYEKKFYDHEIIVGVLSEKFPDIIFSLTVYREDGEIWRKYFYNGKVHRAETEIIFEMFDKSNLSKVEY